MEDERGGVVYKPPSRVRVNGKKKRISHLVLEVEIQPDEVVHHINGDTSDNRPENLQVMKRSEHTKLHQERNYKYGVSAAEDKKEWQRRYKLARQGGFKSLTCSFELAKMVRHLAQLGLPQYEIASLTDLSKSYVSRIINHKRRENPRPWRDQK